ncbi:MAG: hypothetical protein HQL51_03500 [Magnetococcales bacterium]|nr:hypothetical protein [Magnetococcales bacterium]
MIKKLSELTMLLKKNFSGHQLVHQIAEKHIEKLATRLYGFNRKDGYETETVSEQQFIFGELFGPNLVSLRATSFQMKDGESPLFRSFWNNAVLGVAISTHQIRDMTCILVCDSKRDCIETHWFRLALNQIRHNPKLKVYIYESQNPGKEGLTNFAIFEHQSNQNQSTYIFDAPHQDERSLRTSLIVNHDSCNIYTSKFVRTMESSGDNIKLLETDQELDEIPVIVSDSKDSISNLFSDKIILRGLKRIDSNESLLGSENRFVRKYEPDYAKLVGSHIRKRFGGANTLIYVGDTCKNDGGAIRNLQSHGFTVFGFVCNQKMERVWVDNILYTDRWTDLVSFHKMISTHLCHCNNEKVLAVFDIDQTLWAPKGVNEGVIKSARISAIIQTLQTVTPGGSKSIDDLAKLVYKELDKDVYEPLAEDNEDFKAIITIALACSVFASVEFERQFRTDDLVQYNTSLPDLYARLKKYLGIHEYKSNYNSSLANQMDRKNPPSTTEDRPKPNISVFLEDAISAIKSLDYGMYASHNGIDPIALEQVLQEVADNIELNIAAPFSEFREKERDETIAHAEKDAIFHKINDILTLNHATWDYADFLNKKLKIPLLALSDRPDEATISPEPGGKSLLNVALTIHGQSIRNWL